MNKKWIKKLLPSSKIIKKKKSLPSINFPKISNFAKSSDVEQNIIELIKLFFNFVKDVFDLIQVGGKKIDMVIKKPLTQLVEKIIFQYKIHSNQPLYQKFGLEIKNQHLLENLVKIIQKKYLQVHFIKLNRMDDFDSLEILCDLDFESIFKNALTDIQTLTELKIDFLLTAINNPTHFDMKKVKDILLTDSIQQKTSFFHFQKDNSLLTRIATSDVAIEGYLKSLQTQTSKKLNSDDIKSKVYEILDKMKVIYIAQLPNEYMGITLFNGKIFINEKFYRSHHLWSQQKNATILIILCHEILHILRRLIIEENYFNGTISFERNSIQYVDLGDYYDKLLYGEFGRMYEKNAAYLMDINNWDLKKNKKKFSEFRKNFKKIWQNISKKEKKKTGFLMKTNERTIAPFGAISIGFCAFHHMRASLLLD